MDRGALRWRAQLVEQIGTIYEQFGLGDWRLPVGQCDQAAAELRNVLMEDDGVPWDQRLAVLAGMQLCMTLLARESGLMFLSPGSWRSLAVTADMLGDGL